MRLLPLLLCLLCPALAAAPGGGSSAPPCRAEASLSVLPPPYRATDEAPESQQVTVRVTCTSKQAEYLLGLGGAATGGRLAVELHPAEGGGAPLVASLQDGGGVLNRWQGAGAGALEGPGAQGSRTYLHRLTLTLPPGQWVRGGRYHAALMLTVTSR